MVICDVDVIVDEMEAPTRQAIEMERRRQLERVAEIRRLLNAKPLPLRQVG